MPRFNHESIKARARKPMKINVPAICLSNKDAEIFFNLLDTPPEANEKLKKAVKNYRARI